MFLDGWRGARDPFRFRSGAIHAVPYSCTARSSHYDDRARVCTIAPSGMGAPAGGTTVAILPLGAAAERLSWGWRGPGGPRGLQNRCAVASAVAGGFDSHAPP